MKASYPLLAVLCAAVAISTSNCGDRTATGPEPVAIQASVTDAGPHEPNHPKHKRHRRHHAPPGLAQCRPQHADLALRRIGAGGGKIDIGPYTLTVPPGALDRDVVIGARIRAGESVNVVEFQPDGLVFAKPARLSMTYENCEVHGDEDLLRIAVVDDAYQIIEYLTSTNEHPAHKITAEVPHFTNYAVAW